MIWADVQIMYQDDTFLLSWGFSLRICKDSQIFLCGWSSAFCKIWTVRGMSRRRVWCSWWSAMKWSPIGVSGVLFFALRTCSLNLSLMGLFVSPMYVMSFLFPWQITHVILYTTPDSKHLPLTPDSQALHSRPPDGHCGGVELFQLRGKS